MAWRIEHAFRQEVLVFVLGVIFAFMLPVSGFQKLVLIGVLLLVLIVELINSAIEAIVDRISLERHPLSKNAKDFGSAAVGLTVLLAAITWGTVLYSRFM
jgi:diacylglycerol kinase (ATP)